MFCEPLSLDVIASKSECPILKVCCRLDKLFFSSSQKKSASTNIIKVHAPKNENHIPLLFFEKIIGHSSSISFEGHGSNHHTTGNEKTPPHPIKLQIFEKLMGHDVIKSSGEEILFKELLIAIDGTVHHHKLLNTPENHYCIEMLLKYLLTENLSLDDWGKLLWFLDQHPEDFIILIEEYEPRVLLDQLHKAFIREIEGVVARIRDSVEMEKKIGIQSGEEIENILIPLEISRLIITDQGYINVGLLKSIQHFFTGDLEVVFNHNISIKQTLELFLESDSLRKAFENIQAPRESRSRIASVVRLSLSMAPHEALSAIDAKRAIMMALLSHLRQHASQSCFASFLAIQLKQSYLEDCLSDLISLLANGHLSREIDGSTRHFPFLMKMSNPYLNQKFQLNADGEIQVYGETTGRVTESSGLMAASIIMGFPLPEQGLLEAIKKTYGTVTPNEIIQQMARDAARNSGHDELAGKFYHEGCFAFGSKTLNPLLKIWVNTIAGMAEGQANCYFSSCLIKSLLQLFHKHLTEKFSIPQKALEKVEESLCRFLALSIRYMYDPTIGWTTSLDEGGFVLYESRKRGTRLKRIDNAKSFIEFLFRVLDKSQKLTCTNKSCHKMFDTLKVLIRSKKFPQMAIKAYQALTMGKVQDSGKIEKVTPWINLFGHNAHAIMQVYFENGRTFKACKIKPKNSESLLRRLIDMGRNLSHSEKKGFINNPYALKPVRIVNYHAFSLILGHSSLKEVWADEINPEKWLQLKILEPGLNISASLISQKQRERLLNVVCDTFPAINLKKLSQMPKKASLHRFRKALLALIPDKDPKIRRLIDSLIIDTMDKNLKNEFLNTVIHFADTNLHSGIHDVHFCFVLNPGSGEIEIWRVNDNNTELIPLDQKEISKGKVWEIYLDSDKLLDSSD